jgi:hypothetical protein
VNKQKVIKIQTLGSIIVKKENSKYMMLILDLFIGIMEKKIKDQKHVLVMGG